MSRSALRGTLVIALTLVVIGVMLFAPSPTTREPKQHPPNLDPWVLVSYDPADEYGTYLGNGLIAARIKADGVGNENGKALPCFVAGFYNDEKLIPTPTWSDLRFHDGSTEFRIDRNATYKQSLNMRTGILATEATWRAGSKTLQGTVEVIVSRADPNTAMLQAELSPNFDGRVRVSAPIRNVDDGLQQVSVSRNESGSGVSRSYRTKQSGIWLHLIAKLVTDAESMAAGKGSGPAIVTDVARGRRFAVLSCISIATGPDRRSAEETAHRSLMPTSGSNSYDYIPRHRAAWAKLWEKDIIIDGPRKDQQALRSCMFYLLGSVREGSQWSIPPMGLSDNFFSGHIFWDADLWMFPALILQHPELARAIVDYRYNTLPGAFQNAKVSGYAGAEYAWESGHTGVEDTPPGLSYRYERHINGDVAIAQWQYYLATGDREWLKTRGYPVLKATADYWVSRAIFVADRGRYEILKVVPPDENAEIIDNSVYTNAIARINLQLAARAAALVGAAADPKWNQVAAKMHIALDEKELRFIAFDGYRGVDAKQADAELLVYPLQFELPGRDMQQIHRNTFAYYASKVIPNGPAMSSSAHAVIAARFGDPAQAYKHFTASYAPFLRGPFNYFNEKRSLTYEAMCFLTGAAGPIQAALFGLAGARMDYFADGPADLSYSPCLPPKWKSLKVTGVQWRGETFDIVVSEGNKVELTRAQAAPERE